MKKNAIIFIILTLLPVYLFTQDRAQQEDLMYANFERGFDEVYSNKDSAYHYLGKALKIASDISEYNTELDILSYMVIASDNHYDIKNYNVFLEQTKALLEQDSITSKVKNLKVYQNLYLQNKANYYYKTNELVKAKSIYLDLRAEYNDKPIDLLSAREAQSMFSINFFLATIYKHLGRFELSEQFYLKNRSLINDNESLADYSDSYINNLDHLIAQLYGRMGRYERANKLQDKVLNYYKTKYFEDKKYKNNLVSAYQEITNTLIEQDSLKKALSYLDESQEYLLVKDPFYKQSLLLYGDIYSKQSQYQNAFDSYQAALKAFQEYRQKKPHQDIAEVYGKIAELHLKQNNFEEGLKIINKAFNSCGYSIQINNNHENPNPYKVFSKTQLLNLLDVKLQLLEGLYKTGKDTTYLNLALKTSHDILQTFDLLKKEFESKLDKQFLVDKAYPVFYRMLAIAHKAYKIDPSKETMQLALNISEKNKDFLLLEALRSSQATTYGDVSNTMLEKESQLRAKITYLEKENFNAKEVDDTFSEELFNFKEEYYNFLDTLKVKYPKYHDLKYQNNTLELDVIRNKILNDEETLISFTMTSDHLYAIIMNDADEQFMKLSFSEQDRKMIRDFYQLISTASMNQEDGAISKLGDAIYNKILKEALEQFECEKLIIIADDVLHYLPFDVLKNNGDYLLKTHAISYGNSINTLLELHDKKKPKTKEVLAFAPSFGAKSNDNEEREFGQLLYNDDEVAKISNYFKTEIFIEERASLENFRTFSPDADIVHLATHASANDEFPDYSHLAFSEDDTENLLYIKDLYNTSLKAELVVLSACQTGIGKLQQGQGMLSLSKGFYYAGAKSLVNTLWKINDKSTAKLMDYFYKEMKEGKSKAEALRAAKLTYLETTEDNLFTHPYYWSAFVVSGNIDPITNHFSNWWVILIGTSIVAVVLYLKRKKSV